MKKILLLPLFTMESGHHRSSNALMESLKKHDPYMQCEKVDFLSYMNSGIEKFISHLYLNWINNIPSVYSTFYNQFFNKESKILQSTYEAIFLEKMEQLIEQKQPDLIICTHSFPSFLVNKLKEYGVCKIPVVNVYTDFFINDLWGKTHIDMHLVPSKDTKEQLIKASIPEENILITGIVTNDKFLKRKKEKSEKEKVHILVAGGSLGLGKQLSSLKDCVDSKLVEYRVLCGSNSKLYEEIDSLNSDSIKPLSYITSPEQMNHLYNWADALITKPGGVTISEAIKKKLPIFIHSVLPGQEEVNMDYLAKRGLVRKLNNNVLIEEQILSVLNNPIALFDIRKSMHLFLSDIEINSCEEVAEFIFNRMTKRTINKRVQYIDHIFSRLYYSL